MPHQSKSVIDSIPSRGIGNYLDAREAILTKADAIREAKRHDATECDLLAHLGDNEFYNGAAVLDWLGY